VRYGPKLSYTEKMNDMNELVFTSKKKSPVPSVTPVTAPILQRKCACGVNANLGNECEGCRHKHRLAKTLTIGRLGDQFEQEADRLAWMVTSGEGGFPVSNLSSAQVQRLGAGSQVSEASAQPQIDSVLSKSGQPLDLATQTFMERRFGHDFSQVRVHTDGQAAASARAVNALAYTVGSHVVFESGQYAPHTPGGQHLLAHELTHVLQQGQGTSRVQRYGMDNAPYGDPDRDMRLRHLRSSGPRAIEVTAIDDVDTTGWLESFFSIGEVNFTDLNSMVANILTALGTSQMRRLNIQIHGSPSDVAVGSTVINTGNFATYQATLARLSGHFTSGGFVHLRACEVGQNLPLMRLFAATFGVTVYAGRGYQNNIYGVNTGYIVRCEPNGTCTTQFFQP